jgi:type II secretory pathway pseudopilin PulG
MRRFHGFSILEMLVAAVILAGVVTPLFNSLQASNQQSARILEEMLAANAATSMLEELGAVPYSSLPIVGDDTPEAALAGHFHDPTQVPVVAPPPAGYARTISIAELYKKSLDSSQNSRWGNQKLVTVKVSWQPESLKGLTTRILIFSTLVTDDMEAP